MAPPALTRAFLLVVMSRGLAAPGPVPAHDFSAGASMLWADYSPAAVDFPLSAAALADLAGRYRIHSLEQCFGCPWGSTDGCVPLGGSEAHIISAARGLKAANASALVLMYTQGQRPRSCYVSNTEYMANVQTWALRYDAGAYAGGIIPRDGPTTPRGENALDDNTFLDPRAPGLKEWYAGIPYAAPGGDAVIDGIFSDTSGYQNWYGSRAHNVSVAATAAISAARLDMLAAAHTRGTVIYNGLDASSRYAPDWNSDTLNVTDGANIEHFGAFECVLADGRMNTTMFGELLAEIFRLGAADGGAKAVVVKAWPGPVVAPLFFLPESTWGPHRMSPSWA